MARIPVVPDIDPVNKPTESPAEAGKPGEAISQLGAESNDVAITGLDFDIFLKKAQQHVDSLAAQNQMAAVYADTQNQLSKTQNSKDVAGVIEQSNKTLNDLSKQWSSSPAAIEIQMSADALRPDLSRIGTVKQVDLMNKEFKTTISQQGEILAGSYAADRGAGGSGDMALGAFSTAVKGGVDTGLVGDVEASDMVRQFRQSGQEMQIKNAITNANPAVNTKIYDQIDQHRDAFPDVTQEQLDTFKGQALSAFEAHTKQKEWAEGQMALQKDLPVKLNQFTNPATGHFDEAAAMTDNADRQTKGEITPTQADVLASAFHAHQAQLEVGLKEEAGKRLAEIDKMFSAKDFKGASAKLEQSRDWFEQNGFSQDYIGALRYQKAQESEVRAENSAARAENRYNYQFQREKQADESQDTFAQVAHFITGGGMLTKADLQSMAGTGKGKMATKDVDEALRLNDAYQKQPDFKAGMDYIDGAFQVPKGSSNDAYGAADRKKADTLKQFQQMVNANPNESKQKIAHDLVQSSNEETIKARADAMFGTTPASNPIRNFFANLFTSDAEKAAAAKAPASAAPARPKGVPDNYQWNPNGNNGKGSWRAPSQ